jgi:hypothetical protein
VEGMKPSIAGLYARTIGWILDLMFIAVLVAPIGAAAHLQGFVTAGGAVSIAPDSGGAFDLLAVVVSAVYCVGFWTTIAATPGQLVANVRVHRMSDRQMLSVGQAAVRWFLLFGVFGLIGAVELIVRHSSEVLFMLQGLWALFLLASTLGNPARQGLHDLRAGSVVDKSLLAVVLGFLTPQAILGPVIKNLLPQAQQPQAWSQPQPQTQEAPPPAFVIAPRIAGTWRRTAAFILDLVPLVVVAGVVGALANVPGVAATTTNSEGTTITGFSGSSSGWSAVVFGLVSAVYSIGSWVVLGATPGQWLLKTRVCAAGSQARLGVPAAIVRWALLWGVFCGLGALAIPNPYLSLVSFFGQLAWLVVLIGTTAQGPTHQGLHDRSAESMVMTG